MPETAKMEKRPVSPVLCQGDAKAVSRENSASGSCPNVIRVTRPWAPPTLDEKVRNRILSLLAGDPTWRRPNQDRWSWWALRQAIGGGVRTEDVRRVIDELLKDGLLIEVHEVTGDRRTDRRRPRHLLVLADRWHEHQWGDLVEVRGREDVLERLGLLGLGRPTDAARYTSPILA